MLVLLFVLGLPYADPSLLVTDYMNAKVLHLLGVGWFYGGLITSSVAVSRFIWMQPALDHEKLAHGFRFLLVLEVFCIPSIILIAYAGMAMVSQLGGIESQPWAHQGYLALLYSPVVLMITPAALPQALDQEPERQHRARTASGILAGFELHRRDDARNWLSWPPRWCGKLPSSRHALGKSPKSQSFITASRTFMGHDPGKTVMMAESL